MTTFIDFARAHGVQIEPSRFMPGERIRRCGTVDKPKSTNGAWYWDGSRGFVWNWSGEARPQWFEDQNAKPWTDAEKRAWALRQQTDKATREAGYKNAALRADIALRSAKLQTHNYFEFKGFKDELGFVAEDGSLLIPMRALSGRLQGLQVIRWIEDERRYEKKMTPGMRAKGAVFRIGRPQAPETILVEGYVTGLSVASAQRSVGMPASVLVTFSDSNMVHVAPMVQGRCMVYADNDKSGAGERAAKETGLPYCMSDTVGNDANDDHQSIGLIAVAKKIMEVRMRR